MTDSGSVEHRRDDRVPIALRVDYDDAEDLLTDYTQNLSKGGACIASSRELPVGTEVRLALSFPGLVQPIRLNAVVRWTRGGVDALLGVEFADASARDELAFLIERIRTRDPALVHRAIRILVVEDNPHVAELLGLAFGNPKNLGPEIEIECRFASDGAKALDALHATKFDAIIVDVYLPVIDGPKLIAMVRAEMATHLPIIAVSAGGDPAHRAAIEAGADIFIDKPMRLRRVIDTMRAIMKLDATK